MRIFDQRRDVIDRGAGADREIFRLHGIEEGRRLEAHPADPAVAVHQRFHGLMERRLAQEGLQMLDVGHAAGPPRLHRLQDLPRRIGARPRPRRCRRDGRRRRRARGPGSACGIAGTGRRAAGRTSGPGSPRPGAIGRRRGRIRVSRSCGRQRPPKRRCACAAPARMQSSVSMVRSSTWPRGLVRRRLAQAVGRVLIEDRGDMLAGGRQAGIAQGGDHHLQRGLVGDARRISRSRRRARHNRSSAPGPCARTASFQASGRPSRARCTLATQPFIREMADALHELGVEIARLHQLQQRVSADRRWRRRPARGPPRRRSARRRRPISFSIRMCSTGALVRISTPARIAASASASATAPMPPMGR